MKKTSGAFKVVAEVPTSRREITEFSKKKKNLQRYELDP